MTRPHPYLLPVTALLGGLALAAPTAGQTCPDDQDKLTASNGVAEDRFGEAVAIDGTVAIVGAPRILATVPGLGWAYLFDTTTGQELAVLAAADGVPGERFGGSVGICGATAIVGAEWDNDNGSHSGSAYLFDVPSGQQLMKLLPDDGAAGAWFGYSVAVDGNTAVVGAKRDGLPGSAYLFDVATGQQTAKLVPADGGSGDEFGQSVAISGTTAIVGAWGADTFFSGSGAAYLFDTTTGNQIGKLAPPGIASGGGFGLSVGISGAVAIVGAPGDNDNGDDSGSAFLFDLKTVTLTKLLPSDGAVDDLFGRSVAISGSTAVVGALGSGSAHLFDIATGEPYGLLTPAEGASNQFGDSCAISGTTAIVGAEGDDDNGWNSGAAYVFRGVQKTGAVYCTAKPNSQGCATAVSWSGAPSVSDPGPFDVFASPVISNKNGIFFYGTSGRAAILLSGGILCAAPPLRRTGFQNSFGSAPPTVDCSGAFGFDFNAWAQSGADPTLVAGQQVNAQYWWRDPAQADGTGVALTDALEFFLCP